MKHIQTFESFLNEAAFNEAKDLSYWKEYSKGHTSQSPKWMKDEVRAASEVDGLVDLCIEYWNDEADGEENKVPASSKKHIFDLAMQYFNKFKTINGNIISAMISQEA